MNAHHPAGPVPPDVLESVAYLVDAIVGVWAVDARGVTTWASPRMAAMLGVPEGALPGRSMYDFLEGETREESARNLAHKLSIACAMHDFRFDRADGTPLWARVATRPTRDASGAISGAVVVVADVSDKVAAIRLLEQQALRDPLTGLPNRVLLLDRLTHSLARARRHDRWVAVAFCDLDGFKDINDSLGHAAGDRALVTVAERLCLVTRPSDTVARYGGDELVIVMDDLARPEDAARLARAPHEALAPAIDLGGTERRVSVSVGVVVDDGRSGVEALLAAADRAMYDAKHLGGAQTRFAARRTSPPPPGVDRSAGASEPPQ